MTKPSASWLLLTFASLPLISAETPAPVMHSSPVTSFNEDGKNLSVLLVSSLYIAHHFPLLALGEELVSRGHRVAMVGPVVEGVSTLPDISVKKGIEFYNGGNVSVKEYRDLMDGFKNNTNLVSLIYNVSKAINQSSKNYLITLREAIDKLDSSEWDFVVADNAAVTVMHYIMKQWHTDRVIMNLSPLPVLSSFAPPWTFPRGLTGLPDNMNFKERFFNALLCPIETLAMWLLLSSLFIPEDKQKSDLDLMNSPGHVYPVLVNTVIGLEYPKTIMPLAHFIGPLLSDKPTPLSSDLQKWLQNCPERSVVYISMGTSAELTSELASEIMEGIGQYRIVWSLRKSNQGILSDLAIDPERVFISEWISQLALLQHPAVAMSIMHCAPSVQESFYYGKPVICIPYGADQFDTSVRVKTLGYGIRIFAQELTREKVMDAIRAIEKGPYYANVQKLAKIIRMAGGTRRAADLVEFYAEVGHQHGVPAYIKYNWSWVQYYNVDVQVVNAIVLTVTGWAVIKMLKCCCRCCSCQKKTAKKLKTN